MGCVCQSGWSVFSPLHTEPKLHFRWKILTCKLMVTQSFMSFVTQKWLFLNLDVSQNLKHVSWVHFCQWMQMVLDWSQSLVGGLEQAYRNGSNDSDLFELRPSLTARLECWLFLKGSWGRFLISVLTKLKTTCGWGGETTMSFLGSLCDRWLSSGWPKPFWVFRW